MNPLNGEAGNGNDNVTDDILCVSVSIDGRYSVDLFEATLEDLSLELGREGYTGPAVRAYDSHGFARGWVSAKGWSNA